VTESSGSQPTGPWVGMFDDAGSSVCRFAGSAGLERLTGPGAFSASDPDTFSAQLRRAQFDHIGLEVFTATAHEFDRTEQHLLHFPFPTLTFMLVADGVLEIVSGGAMFDLEHGHYLIADGREALRYAAPRPVRVLRATIALDHVPLLLQQRGTSLLEPLRRTALTNGYVAFISTLLRIDPSGQDQQGRHLVAAVAGLHSAVLAEAQDVLYRPPVPNQLRNRMEQYIEEHLDDPDLGPRSIADAVGVSLRHAHGTFDYGSRTIARFIRERRALAVAAELRHAEQPSPLSDLARRYGFRSTDSLQRAFQAKFGLSVREYMSRADREDD
jgi:AraC-like DNA-binding protein